MYRLAWLSFLLLLLNCNAKKEKDIVKEASSSSTEVGSVHEPEKNRLSYGGIPAFVYHRFGDSRYPSTNIDLREFKEQLSFLKDKQYTTYTFSEAVEMIKKGEEIPAKAVVLTIDDGYKSFLSALPLLKENNFKATLFINTETVGGEDYLDWEDLRKIANSANIEIGNHTHSHPYFLNLPSKERETDFSKEVTKAQQLIKNRLDITCKTFAYPYGEYNREMMEQIEQLGFEAAAAQNSGVMSAYSNVFALPRFPMGGSFGTFKSFKNKISLSAFPVLAVDPQTTRRTEARPVLTVKIDTARIDPKSLQCFIQGSKTCSMSVEGNKVKVQSDTDINSRRALYTITAPQRKEMAGIGSATFGLMHQ